MRKLSLTLFLSFPLLVQAHVTGDSLNYLTAKDTVFLHVDDFGNKIFEHTLEKGQTLFSLARFYGLKTDAVYAYNEALQPDGAVPLGAPIKIPIPDSAIVKYHREAKPASQFVPVCYRVKHGDTFYRISKTYFGLPLDTLKKRNNLQSTLLHTGQVLLVGWLSLKGIPDSLQLTKTNNPLSAQMARLQMAFDHSKSAKPLQFQNGAAYWQREKKGEVDFYALHREAAIGSVIQVTNPMKRKMLYAKIIGRIPDRAYGDDVIVVLSPSVARLLGAKDPRFFVEIRYFK
jgi:LysM repeat protein